MIAPTIRIQFSDVGRARKTWIADIPVVGDVPDDVAMVRSIHKAKALASRGVDIGSDDERNLSGDIYAGMRPVGRWSVCMPEEEVSDA